MKTRSGIAGCALIILVLILSLSPSRARAQFFTGGELSVTFVGGFNADIAPIVGYKIQKFSVGLSPVLMYTATGNTSGDFSYGGRIFAEYSIYKGLFGHAEFGMMNTGYMNWNANPPVIQRNWVMSAPIGVGYEHEITNNVWFKTMILYDPLLLINLNQSSPLANPSVRGGITYVIN